MKKTIVVRGIRGCARCGGNHRVVEAKAFRRPIQITTGAGMVIRYWLTCPKTKEPVLVTESDIPFLERTSKP